MAARPAKFPANVKVGGNVPFSGRILDLASDGSELVYGDPTAVFRLPRGAKALDKIETDRSIVGAAALGGGTVAVALSGLGDEPPRIDVLDAGKRTSLVVPGEGSLNGCLASRQAEALVGWGRASLEDERLVVWWWRLGSAAPPVAHTLPVDGVVLGASFVGATLFVSAAERIFSVTPKGVAPVADVDAGALHGARDGSRLLARLAKQFVVLGTDGKAIQSLPPVLKLARLTADGKRVVGYGAAFDVRTPLEMREKYPEWARTDFLAQFDAATGERLGWGKVADSADLLALVDGEAVVTKSVKRIAFHPWTILEGS